MNVLLTQACVGVAIGAGILCLIGIAIERSLGDIRKGQLREEAMVIFTVAGWLAIIAFILGFIAYILSSA